jgi:predicted nuclease of predicted toxin-antitoxin system
MRFLADMGVSIRVVDWLRTAGHDAVHLRERGLQRLPNGAIFEKAAAESRILLTFDLDFGEIVALSAGRAVSVVVFRLHNARSDNQIGRLRKVLAASGSDLEAGAIVVLEEARHRVRRLPLGI